MLLGGDPIISDQAEPPRIDPDSHITPGERSRKFRLKFCIPYGKLGSRVGHFLMGRKENTVQNLEIEGTKESLDLESNPFKD